MTPLVSADPTLDRLDRLVVARGLAPSRERAQLLIRKGHVQVEGKPITRTAELVPTDSAIEVTGDALPYVSRGGLKLAAALDQFRINVEGWRCLDIGISTGGFADCLLQRNASHIVGVDVGHGQLHPSLESDPRIVLHEHINARNLTADQVGEGFDLACVDVSFISLTLVLPAIVPLVRPGGWIIALIKPEFEAGKEAVGFKGIVRSPAARKKAIDRVITYAKEELGLRPMGHLQAPRLGGTGNQEYAAGFKRPEAPAQPTGSA